MFVELLLYCREAQLSSENWELNADLSLKFKCCILLDEISAVCETFKFYSMHNHCINKNMECLSKEFQIWDITTPCMLEKIWTDLAPQSLH